MPHPEMPRGFHVDRSSIWLGPLSIGLGILLAGCLWTTALLIAADKPAPASNSPVKSTADKPAKPADAAKPTEKPTDESAEPEPGSPTDTARRIYIANADGSDMRVLTKELREWKFQGSPVWSADGKQIAFDAWRPEEGESNNHAKILLANVDGSNVRILGDGCMPSFSPRAKRIAMSRYSPNHGVWIMSSEGPETELVLLDEKGWGIDWSPDGRKVVYSTYGGSQQGANFVVVDLVEGDRWMVFEGEQPYRNLFWNAHWSPDSEWIVFKGQNQDGKIEVGIVNARGAQYGLITRVEGEVSPAFGWSPDGSRILFIQRDPERKRVQVFFVDPKTKDPPLLLPKQDPLRNNLTAVYSPDGKKLALSAGSPPAPKKPAAKIPAAKK